MTASTPMAITARRRALLDTIAYAEGTWDSQANRPRYDITFGYQKFDPSKPHPDRVVRSGGYASAASGAYQFMPRTWAGAHGGQNVAMTPQNQDVAALRLVQGRGALGRFDKEGLTPGVVDQLAPEWASFPTAKGGSYYGQPSKPYDRLRKFFEQRLAAAGDSWVPPADLEAPVAAPAGSPAPAASVASTALRTAEDEVAQRFGEALASGDGDPWAKAFGWAPRQRMAGSRLGMVIQPIGA